MLNRSIYQCIFLFLGLTTLLPADAVSAKERSEGRSTWRWERNFQDRTFKSTLKLVLKDKKLTGTYQGLGEKVAIQDAKLKENELTFQVEREFNGQKFTLDFQGKIEGDKLTGNITIADRELDWEAKRTLDFDEVLGIWQFKIILGSGQSLTPSLKLTKKEDKLVGLYTSPYGEMTAKEIKMEGMELSFKISGENDGNPFSVVYKGRPNNNSIKGNAEYDFNGQRGTIAFEGKREPKESKKKDEKNEDKQKSNAEEKTEKSTSRTEKPLQAAPDLEGLIGRKIEKFTLKDFRGNTHSLADYKEKKAIVLFFMGTECPLAKLYGPRLEKMSQQLASQGVAFLGLSSNAQDSITELSAYARIHEVKFPLLKDLNNKVANLVGATRTPQVFLLDRDRKIRYYGRIDAQFSFGSGVGLAQPQEQRNDLLIAIEELLAGKPVTLNVTETKGCIIGRVRQPDPNSKVTYSDQISRLIQKRCLECHRSGQIAPFAMTEYEEVAGWGEMMAEVVREQRMPPWHANPHYGNFSNANLLTDAEKQLIYTWVENGCPEGDPADLPEPIKFHEGWFIKRKPDMVVTLPKRENIKAEGVEDYRYIVVDPKIKEDKWIKLAECMPDNKAVVHHIIVYVRPPKPEKGSGRDVRGFYFLAGFAPGTRPLMAPKGWAKKIPADSKLMFEMHYTPIGSPQTDQSSIGLVFMDEKDVTHQMSTTNAANNRFSIPPYDPNYEVKSSRTFTKDTILLSMFPHMHMRGKSFRYELVHPGADKKREILLDVPFFDFNWQTSYILSEPRLIPKGSVIRCTAYFDNSENNLANPDPSKTITWGDQTWEEMMIGWYDIGVPIKEIQKSET